MAPLPVTPPAHDADLDARTPEDLLGLVGRITGEIDSAEVGLAAQRARRARAFRLLRDKHGVPRTRIAQAAGGMTDGAVSSSIADLERRERALVRGAAVPQGG